MSNTVPKEWQIKTVDEVATVFAGGTPSRSNPDYYEGTIPWVKSGEVNTRLIYRTEETISELAVKESSARWAKRGSVLVAMYGATAGKAARLMIDATLNQAVSAINGRENTADNWFLLYAIENNTRELLNTVQGSGQPNLSGQLIKTLNLPIPPLPEQQKIAAILSSVDDVIEKTRAQIDKLKDLKTGMMQELLTKGIGSGGVPHTEFKDSPVGRIPASWSVIELKQIAAVKGGKRMPKGKPFAGHVTPHPYIRVSDLGNGTIRQDNLKYVLPKDREAIKRYTISKNDLYISIAGTIGMVGSVPEALDGAQLTENAAKIVFYDLQSLCPSFVKHVLTSGEVQERLNQEKGTGGGVPKLALFRIESTELPMPPLPEQRSIGKALDSMDQRLAVTHGKLNALMMCKKALMQDLLTGKVRVKVDQKESAVA